ncbi:MAG: hypothetical protein IJ880_14945 [Bacilli bacterium]|nr:hypothetical protein [Bacilli bacterium]
MDDNDLRKQIQKSEELSKLLNNTGKKTLMDKYCNKCFGTGVKRCWDDDREIKCTRCGGTGKEPLQSNEEWFNGLSVEEKAKVIVDMIEEYIQWEYGINMSELSKETQRKYIKKWLNENHREE